MLTNQGVAFTQVEVLGARAFGSLRHGAGFYVTCNEHCRGALAQAGYSRGLVQAPGSAAE